MTRLTYCDGARILVLLSDNGANILLIPQLDWVVIEEQFRGYVTYLLKQGRSTDDRPRSLRKHSRKSTNRCAMSPDC